MRIPTLLLALAWCATALAAPTPEERAKARERYGSAVTHFNAGEYAAAAEDFIAVHKISPQPALLYNVAQAYRLGNDSAHALEYYKQFLREAPDARQARDVERRIQELQSGSVKPVAATPPDMSAPAKSVKPQQQTIGKNAPTAGSDRLGAVAEVIKQNRAGFRGCFDKWSKANPGVDGKVTLTFFLDPDGNLDQPDAALKGFLAPEVGDCIEALARTLHYPKSPSGKFTRFTYPFDFKAAR